MAESEDSFIQFAGRVVFPRTPTDLTSTTQCPACFTPLTGTICQICHFDLNHPAAGELAVLSADAATLLDRRLELIGRMRYQTTQLIAARSQTVEPQPAPIPTPGIAQPAPIAPLAAPVAVPRRSGVQVLLLIVGVSLLSVAAIFFIVFAFITFGLAWRTVIIAAITVAAFATASLLRRKRLVGTAEAIGVFAVILVYLDAFALRANHLFGLGLADGLVYWGATLIASSVGFVAWHRLSGLRVASIAAFVAFAPGFGLLTAGLTGGFEDGTRTFIAFAAVAIAGLVHPLAARSATATTPTFTGRVEKLILLSFAILGLVLAAIVSLAIEPTSDWAPAIALFGVALIALAHVVIIASRQAFAVFARVFAGVGGVAAAAAISTLSWRVDDTSFAVFAPAVAAATVALALEVTTRRLVSPILKSSSAVAAWSAAAIAVLTLLPALGIAVLHAVSVTAIGFIIRPWGPPDAWWLSTPAPENYAAVAAIAIVIVLGAAFSAASGVLVKRRALFLWASYPALMLAAPLANSLWGILASWFLLAALGVSWLSVARLRQAPIGPAIRTPLIVWAIVSMSLGYALSWASIDSWLIGSLLTIAILIAARFAFASAAVATRAVLLAVATVVALIAAGALGRQLSMQYTSFEGGAALDTVHFVGILAIALIAVSALPLDRIASGLDRRTVFWIAAPVAAVTTAISWMTGAVADPVAVRELLLPEFGTSLAMGAAVFGALLLWILLPGNAVHRGERIVASVAIAPTVSWLVDSFTRVLELPDFIGTVAPISAALIVSAGALTMTLLRPSRTPRWAREVGIGLVAVPAVFAAVAVRTESTWLVLILAGITVLFLAINQAGLFSATGMRKHFGWLALGLATAGLWWRLAGDEVTGLEPFVLPLAGALLLIALLVWRAALRIDPPTPSRAAPLIALGGLLVAILPIAANSTTGPVTRTIIIAAASAVLLLVGSLVIGNERLRPYLDAAAVAGAIGVIVAAIGRSTLLVYGDNGSYSNTADASPGASLDAWLAAAFILLLIAAFGQARLRPDANQKLRLVTSQAIGLFAMTAVLVLELSAFDSGVLGPIRAVAVVLLFAALHLVAVTTDQAPFTRLVSWVAIAYAGLATIVGVGTDALDPLEIGTVSVALALIAGGVVHLARTPTARSWPSLGPGVLVLLVPSLVATIEDRPLWRLVALGVVGVAVMIIGVVRRLQAPFIIGAVVLLIHGIATFAPQIVAVYESAEWWLWAAIGGAIIIFLSATYEKRMRDLKNVTMRITELR